MIYAYPQEVHDFVREHCRGRRPAELAEMCNEALGTEFTASKMKVFMTNHGYKNGLGALTREEYRKYHSKWPDGMYEFVRDNSYGVDSKKLAEMVNERFGVGISQQNMKAYCQRHGIKRGITGWYHKGHEPANKGKKWEEYFSPEAMERSRTTTFKKGQVAHNLLPIGAITIVNGHKLIKVGNEGKHWDRWKALNRWTWEQHNCPVPDGMCVAHKDGNPLNCDIENLMLMTRAEIATMSRLGLRFEDPELTEAGLNVVRIKHKISKIRKNKN